MRLRFSVCAGHAPDEPARHEAWRAVEVSCSDDGVSIGRQRGASIELPFPTVSARHARVFWQGGAFRIEDLDSSNGTLLGSRRLLPHAPLPIAAGEVLVIAGVKVRFDGELEEAKPVSSSQGTDTLARRLVHDVFAACPPGESLRLVAVVGHGAASDLVLASSDRSLVVGRGEHCDLVLCDPDVSREHAAFRCVATGVVVLDLGSKNGIEVNGQKVVGMCQLRDGDLVRLGETTLQLVDPEDRYLRQVQELKSDLKEDPRSGGAPREGPTQTTLPPPDDVRSSAAPLTKRASHGRLPLVAGSLALLALLLAAGLVVALVFAT
jgi:pSer/pThr/pTyr-binding forkhead associated (FHA) protein